MSGSTEQERPALGIVGLDQLPALFDTVLDRSGTGLMVFDAHLRIAHVNEVAARSGGYPADVHIGQRLGDLYPQLAGQAEPMLAAALRDGEAVQNEELVWESPRPPHRRRWWAVSYVPLQARDGNRYVAAIYLETSQVRRAHERLTQLIDALPTFVGMCTADGNILETNAATLAATDVARDDLAGRRLWDAPWWSHDALVQHQIRTAVERAQHGEASRFDVEVRILGDRQVTIDFQLVPIVEHGVVTALVPSAMEVSDRIAERDRLQALAELSRHLNAAMTIDEAAQLVVGHASAVVDAASVVVALHDAAGHELRVVQVSGPFAAARWGSLPLDGARTPLHDAFETGETTFVDADLRARRYAELADEHPVDLDTSAAVPLRAEDGTVFGVLDVGWTVPLEPLGPVRTRLALLGDLCSNALRRVQRTEAQDQFLRELQEEVLAAPDPSRHLDVAVTYEPAQTDLGFGGDWYDVIEVGDDHTAFVVGDVAGHGVAAASRMTEAKATIRALVLTAPRDRVLPDATRSLAHLDSGYIATAALAWVDTAAGQVEWRLAGHLPPVLRVPGEPARLLAGPHHPPVGMPTGPRQQPPEPFPVGSLLVLYTDGLVERRTEAIDEGLERLRSLVDALPTGCSAADARDAILRELHAADSEDDVAIVVVRNR